jgi:hypothetical protein
MEGKVEGEYGTNGKIVKCIEDFGVKIGRKAASWKT